MTEKNETQRIIWFAFPSPLITVIQASQREKKILSIQFSQKPLWENKEPVLGPSLEPSPVLEASCSPCLQF